jgi:hypothetical protein
VAASTLEERVAELERQVQALSLVLSIMLLEKVGVSKKRLREIATDMTTTELTREQIVELWPQIDALTAAAIAKPAKSDPA